MMLELAASAAAVPARLRSNDASKSSGEREVRSAFPGGGSQQVQPRISPGSTVRSNGVAEKFHASLWASARVAAVVFFANSHTTASGASVASERGAATSTPTLTSRPSSRVSVCPIFFRANSDNAPGPAPGGCRISCGLGQPKCSWANSKDTDSNSILLYGRGHAGAGHNGMLDRRFRD